MPCFVHNPRLLYLLVIVSKPFHLLDIYFHLMDTPVINFLLFIVLELYLLLFLMRKLMKVFVTLMVLLILQSITH